MEKLLENFMEDVVNGRLCNNPINNPQYPDIQTSKHGLIYNEFSLQHALGAYLRNTLGNEYRIEFERNSEKCFGIPTATKHEIDIVIYNENERKCAIELKFPRNGQYPEQMFSFVKDIAFLEELKTKGKHPFEETYVITLVDDKNFYENINTRSNSYIYKHFRTIYNLDAGTYDKPTGKKKYSVKLKNSYPIKWEGPQTDSNPLAYYIIKVK